MFRRLLRISMRFLLRFVAVFVVVELIISVGLWSIGQDNCIEPDPETGWRVERNLQKAFNGEWGPYLVETNSRGMRDIEHDYARKKGVYRIVALGACGTFGLGVSEYDCYVSKLEKFLPGSETVNLGAVGFSADQEFVLLKEEGLRYQPDLVVQFLIKQDGRAIFYPWVPVMGPKPYIEYGPETGLSMQPPSPHFWSLVSNLTHLPLLASTIDGWHEPLLPEPMPSNEDRFRGFGQLLLETQAACERAGAEYLAVFVPEPASAQTYEMLGEEATTLTPRLLNYLQEQGSMRTLNLMDTMVAATQDETQPAPFAQSDQSLSPTGHEIVARSVADEIRSSQTYQAALSRASSNSVASNGN